MDEHCSIVNISCILLLRTLECYTQLNACAAARWNNYRIFSA